MPVTLIHRIEYLYKIHLGPHYKQRSDKHETEVLLLYERIKQCYNTINDKITLSAMRVRPLNLRAHNVSKLAVR